MAILSVLAVYVYLNSREAMDSGHRIAHINRILNHTENVLVTATNIHSGQLGYALTGNEQFLETFEKANDEIDGYLKALLELTKNNPPRQPRVKALEEYILRLRNFSSTTVEKRKESFEPARLLDASMEGKILLDSIRTIITDIRAEENYLSDKSSRNKEREIKNFKYAYFTLLLMVAVVLLTLFGSIHVHSKKRMAIENQLKILTEENKDLFDNAPCGYHSIDDRGYFVDMNNTLLRWLGYERHEVLGKLKFTDLIDKKDIPFFEKNFPLFKDRGFPDNVEFNFIKKSGTSFPVILSAVAMEDEKGNFVKSRSSTLDNIECKQALEKINNLNRELEDFTYSVSHDLRAPLRSIDGYSRILQEDFGDKLDEEGRRVLNVIMSNAKRMGKLIDDLLDFARLGRKEIQRSRINMTGLVNNILRELLVQEPDRKIDVKVDELDTAFADVDMIRQVWTNLIENAIKYTGKKDLAAIEISSYESGYGELCYKVKDNGVGFDMKYAPKLFGVFQRLHKMQDFSGTGVGLAIVKRIITRHEGRVWAEGTLQEGATFYFTIPNDNENA